MVEIDITLNPTFDLRGLGAPATYAPTTNSWDCAIGGLPFLFGTSKQFPYRRQTADWRRPTQKTTGGFSEDSLDTGYWIRTQQSFHFGAGQRLYEALETDEDIVRFRFNTGGSVDPWTPGTVVPSYGVTGISTTSSTNPLALGTSTGVLYANNTSLSHGSTSLSSITWGGGSSITSITSDGVNWYAAQSGGGIYRGALPTGAGAQAFTSGTLVRWVKQRMIVANGANLYEVTNAQSASAAALPAALYTHPVSTWTWTDVAEGPNAIYVAGYAGSQSAIFRITVTTSGSTVTLNAPTVVAELPRGEVVNTIYCYLGTYLGVGTSGGMRVAVINADGSLQLSPLQFEVTGGVTDMVGSSRFLYVAGGSATPVGDGTTGPGLYRLDLGTALGSGFFAWSPEAAFSSASSSVRSVTVGGGNGYIYATLTSSSTGLVYQDPAATRSTGWLLPPRIRMGTAEQKVYKDIQIRGRTPGASYVECYASTTGLGNPSTWNLIGQLGIQSDGDLSLGAASAGPQDTLYLAFRLVPSGSDYPELYGYRLRAVPAAKKTRLVQLPLMCLDFETDRYGVKMGQRGGAWTRLEALEVLEENGDIVLYQDFTTGEARQAIIEQVQQMRLTPPSRSNPNAGGMLSVTLRLL